VWYVLVLRRGVVACAVLVGLPVLTRMNTP
jgi:hypothetical protein